MTPEELHPPREGVPRTPEEHMARFRELHGVEPSAAFKRAVRELCAASTPAEAFAALLRYEADDAESPPWGDR